MKLRKHRHGDVGLYQVSSLPKGLKKEKGSVLALGEVTGHSHRFVAGDYQFWTDGQKRYIEVLTQAQITHEEHGPQTVLPGVYEQIQEREHDYIEESARAVID